MSAGLIKKLSRLSAVYILGDVVAKGAAFLLLPLYTRFLSPGDYGIIGLSEMIKQVLTMLLSLGMIGAVLRFYHQIESPAERRRFYGTLWLILILVPGLICLALALFGRPLFGALFASVPFDPYIRTAIGITFLNAAFALIPPNLFRAREQPWRYIAFNLGIFAATNLLIAWEVVWRGRGAAGYLEAQLIAAALMGVVACAVLLREVDLRPAWRFVGPLLAYSLPLMPHTLAHWALNLSDRAILERFASLEQLGVYTLAFQFAAVFQLLALALSNALMPLFSRAAKDRRELQQVPRVATYYALALVCAGLLLGLGAIPAIALLTPPAYHAAAGLAPWLVLGYLLMGLYYIPMHGLTFTAGRTGRVPGITLTAAAANIGLNLLLVPQLGALAAAVNTVAGYAVLLLLIFPAAQAACPIPYEYGRLARLGLLAALWCAITLPLLRFHPLVDLAIVAGMVALFPLGLLAVGFWDARERTYLARLVRPNHG